MSSFLLSALLISFFIVVNPLIATPETPKLYVQIQSNGLEILSERQRITNIIEQAKDFGYSGVILLDSKIDRMQESGFVSPSFINNLQSIANTISSLNMELITGVFPFSATDSSAIYQGIDHNLAEPMKIEGTTFEVVANVRTLQLISNFTGLKNPGFEIYQGDIASFWTWQDEPGVRTTVDCTVAHWGSCSGKILPSSNPELNARIVQKIEGLSPRRMYKVSFWVKTDSLYPNGNYAVSILQVVSGISSPVGYGSFYIAPTADWTQYSFTFVSESIGETFIYIGVWGAMYSGYVWYDDIIIEEIALLNIVRRPSGTPIRLYNASNPDIQFYEGVDFENVTDTLAYAGNIYDINHTPPSLRLTATSTLQNGDRVKIDYYAVIPINGWQSTPCLADPRILSYMSSNIREVSYYLPKNSGYYLKYGEIKQAYGCEYCRGGNKGPGGLLAWHVQQATQFIRGTSKNGTAWNSQSPIFVPHAMFDPNTYAVNDFYLVQGDLANSWLGLDSSAIVTIKPHQTYNLKDSVKFFGDLKLTRVLSVSADFPVVDEIYYSLNQSVGSGDGILGFIYETSYQDFGALKNFSDAARKYWSLVYQPPGASPSRSGERDGSRIGLIIGLVIFFILLIVVGVLLILMRRKIFNKITSNNNASTPNVELAKIDTKRSTRENFGKFVLNYKDLVFGEKLGVGAFGVVHKGTYKKTEVAIKTIAEHAVSADISALVEEAKTMLELPAHPNVVLFRGVTLPPDPVCVVTDFCHGGSLLYLLRTQTLNEDRMIELAVDVAKGMLHLHTAIPNREVIHRDLAARNILIKKDGTAAVSDFGLARIKDESEAAHTNSNIGPLKWMAPESCKDRIYSVKSDVFSYGVVLYEIASQEEPWKGLTGVQAVTKVIFGERMTMPDSAPFVFKRIAQRCWNQEPEKRPSFTEIFEILEGSRISTPNQKPLTLEDEKHDKRKTLYSELNQIEGYIPGPRISSERK